jgi:hypothetical protein
MTNKDLPASAEMRDHLTLQAKRLRDRLRISLTGARNILAQAAYRCKDWDDLQQRVAKPVSGDHRLRLAAPPSEALRDYLREEEMAIARAIGNRVLANANLAGMLQTVRFVFEQQEHDILLEDLAPELKTTVWQPTRIGPDPHAVMQCHANVNGQTIKLIATRVYLPAYLNFPAHLKELAPYATNFGEPFSIMWSDPAAWLDAACRYLDIADDADDDYSAFAAPQILLDADMRRHERWFSRLLEYWERNGMYGDDDSEKFQSYLTPHGTYLVFGVPVATSSSDVSETRLDIRGMRGNASVLCHLHGQAISVEAFDIDARTGRHVGEFSEHFDQVNVSLFSHANYACPKVSKNPRTQLFFVTPSTGWDIEHAVSLDVMPEPGKELVSIKTDNMELLGALIDSIAARKVFWNTSASGLRQYFATLKTATEVDGFSLARRSIPDKTAMMSSTWNSCRKRWRSSPRSAKKPFSTPREMD